MPRSDPAGLELSFDAYAERMNTIPKYAASRTLRETTWNATLLEGDVVEAVAVLKEQPGRPLLKVGTSGALSRTLLAHRLVDEYLFWLFPTVAGAGHRLYDGIDTTHLKLAEVRTFTSGIVGLTYTPKT